MEGTVTLTKLQDFGSLICIHDPKKVAKTLLLAYTVLQ